MFTSVTDAEQVVYILWLFLCCNCYANAINCSQKAKKQPESHYKVLVKLREAAHPADNILLIFLTMLHSSIQLIQLIPFFF